MMPEGRRFAILDRVLPADNATRSDLAMVPVDWPTHWQELSQESTSKEACCITVAEHRSRSKLVLHVKGMQLYVNESRTWSGKRPHNPRSDGFSRRLQLPAFPVCHQPQPLLQQQNCHRMQLSPSRRINIGLHTIGTRSADLPP